MIIVTTTSANPVILTRKSANLRAYEIMLTEKEQIAAQREAIVRAKLQAGEVVSFEFRKVNGELRRCIATTNLKQIPREHHPSGRAYYTAEQIRFFDLSVGGWRSCIADQITEIFV
jgi:hypothetical protein